MTLLVQTNIPIPSRTAGTGPDQSAARRALTELAPGHCLTAVAKDLSERKTLAKRMNATITAAKKDTGFDYTLRQMYGEVDGSVAPVVRVWRTG